MWSECHTGELISYGTDWPKPCPSHPPSQAVPPHVSHQRRSPGHCTAPAPQLQPTCGQAGLKLRISHIYGKWNGDIWKSVEWVKVLWKGPLPPSSFPLRLLQLQPVLTSRPLRAGWSDVSRDSRKLPWNAHKCWEKGKILFTVYRFHIHHIKKCRNLGAVSIVQIPGRFSEMWWHLSNCIWLLDKLAPATSFKIENERILNETFLWQFIFYT